MGVFFWSGSRGGGEELERLKATNESSTFCFHYQIVRLNNGSRSYNTQNDVLACGFPKLQYVSGWTGLFMCGVHNGVSR